jgi:hypothetical protein
MRGVGGRERHTADSHIFSIAKLVRGLNLNLPHMGDVVHIQVC